MPSRWVPLPSDAPPSRGVDRTSVATGSVPRVLGQRRLRLPAARTEPRAVDPVTISQHVPWRRVLREGVDHLLSRREEVHGHERVHVIVPKRTPSLRRRLTPTRPILRDRRLGHPDAELDKLAVDARGAPHVDRSSLADLAPPFGSVTRRDRVWFYYPLGVVWGFGMVASAGAGADGGFETTIRARATIRSLDGRYL